MQKNSYETPELHTTFTQPLYFLEKKFLSQCQLIEEWFNTQWQVTLPPVYGSVDLRNAGFKLAPIDMNLFPAGFNNLNPEFLCLAVTAAEKIIQQLMPHTQKILIIPESHTRNLYYWSNVKTLQRILEQAGFQIRLGMLDERMQSNHEIALSSGEKIELMPLLRQQDKLSVAGFDPDLVLLNNDLSEGIPEILKNLRHPLIPPAELGWSQRLKSGHFNYYAGVVSEFAKLVSIDPWLIAPLFRHCGQIDFMQQEGMDCLFQHAEELFNEIKSKYQEYGISEQPFLIVKADSGTYGMAVMTVRHAEELKSLNRKQRTRMAKIKGGQPVSSVIIQEGVYTFETLGPDLAVAEPVVYLWGSQVVGGFYRVHKDKGTDENLNSPGMHFQPLAFSQRCDNPCDHLDPNACQNRFYTYGVIARLSMLAAAREIKDSHSR